MKEQIQILIDKFVPDERKDDLAKYAQEHEFSYQSRSGLARQDFGIRGFKIIKSKYWNELKGILTKEIRELQTTLRVYDYTSSVTKGQQKTTIIEIKSDLLDISKFHIQPRSRIKKIKSLFLDPSNNFHDNYSIYSNNTAYIVDELGSSALGLINEFEKISIEGEENYLLIYHKYKKIKIYNIDNYVRFGIELLETLVSREDNHDFV